MLELTTRQAWVEIPDAELNENLIRRKDARVNNRVFVACHTRKKA